MLNIQLHVLSLIMGLRCSLKIVQKRDQVLLLNLNAGVCLYLERGCVHLYPAPTSGRPTERGAAVREVEPHAERQVPNTLLSIML